MRGRPKARKGKGLLAWRSRQKPGAIMKPATFGRIARTAKGKGKKGLSAERRRKIAGSAYWKTARAKYRKKSRAKWGNI